MSKEKVTVVIPVYNREDYIETAIKSVRNQTLTEWKLIIVNDASTDGTADKIDAFVSDKIVHVRLTENVGTGKALGIALEMIDTPYFVIVDSDDWIEPDTLKKLLKEMERQPKSTSLVFSNTVMWTIENGVLTKRVKKHRSFEDKYDFMLYRKMIYPRFLRTETVRKVGGFETDDPHEGRYAEDRYLLLKLIEVSNFHWVDRNFYHLRRTNSDNVTRGSNRGHFTEAIHYMNSKMFKKWGGKYEPVYEINKHGWLVIKQLKKKK